MSGQQPRYYRPYDSGDESDQESIASTGTTDSWFNTGIDNVQQLAPEFENNMPDFKQFATQLQLQRAAGPPISTIQQDLSLGQDILGRRTNYSLFEPLPPGYKADNLPFQSGNGTTIILIDSRHRDRQVYPQPTNFTLRMPKIFKQVSQVNFAQIKLLTSFYYFRPSKYNTDISIHEQGRMSLYNGILQSTIVKSFIRTGSYGIDDLQTELKIQLNYTPLFYDYINGFDDFVPQFKSTGDFGLNFNEPGDYFFNNTTNQFEPNPTKTSITQHFWKSRYGTQTSYTINQCVIAYYWPVLIECLQDEAYPDFINLKPGIGLNSSLTTTDDVKNWLLYQFAGLDDPVALTVINANLPQLIEYRLKHTFRYFLINKYVVARNSQSQIVYITTPSLNTSLVNLLNIVRDRSLRIALTLNNLTAAQYSNLIAQVDRTRAVLNGMYSYEQTQFLTYFAVPWSQYTLPYYANLSNTFYVQYGLGVTGIATNDGQAIEAGIVPYTTDIIKLTVSTPNVYWPSLQSTTATTIGYINLSTATSTFQQVYTPSISNIDPRHTIIQPNKDNTIYINYLNNAGNAICPIESGKYTVFKFNSPVRQTMQVETLMRPTPYRLPKYNQSNFGSNVNKYFDLSYSFAFTSTKPYPPFKPNIYTMAYDNLPTSNMYTVDGWAASNVSSLDTYYSWYRTYASSQILYTSSLRLDVLTYNRAYYFQFTTPYVSTPQVSNISPDSNYTYRLTLNAVSYSNFTTLARANVQQDIRMFVYHDRGAFQADVGCNRNENPLFFKFSTLMQAGTSSASITFTTYQNQEYYVILRPDDSNFANTFVRVFPSFATSTTVTTQTTTVAGINPATDIFSPTFTNLVRSNFNYSQVYDSNWIRLPIQSNLFQAEPKLSPVDIIYPFLQVPIGYDNNNISSDYTDYIPYGFNSITGSFLPYCNAGIDPINQYLFQSNSPYSDTYYAFFYLNSLNSLFTPAFDTVYYSGLVDYRQLKLAHYYSLNYIPESDCNASLRSGLINPNTTAQAPYTVSTTQNVPIKGYQYGTNCNIQLEKGVMGFSFIPIQGVWDVKRIMFRSAIQNSNQDPNRHIQYLGVYTLGDILSTPTKNITLSTALTVLSNSVRVTYTSTSTFEQNGFDTKGGTYYEFIKDETFASYCNQPILGYDQTPGVMSDQPESMYTCIAFSKYGTPMTIKALSGSAIPYPLYNQVLVSTCYLDGTKAYNSTFEVVVPGNVGQTNWPWATNQSTLFAPQNGYDKTQAQYVLGDAIGTSVLPYKLGIPLENDTSYLKRWTTSATPLQVVATVSNAVLTQDTQFNVFKYDELDTSSLLKNPDYSFTADQVYPSYTQISLCAVAGNTSHFYFLGLLDSGANLQLTLRRFDPTDGTINNYPLNSSYVIPKNGTVQSFSFNDYEQLVLCYRLTTGTSYIYYNTTPGGTMSAYTVAGSSNAIHATDPTISTIYWLPLSATQNTATTVRRWYLGAGNPVSGTQFTFTGSGTPSSWTNLAVQNAANIAQSFDRLFFINQQGAYSSNIYYNKSVNFAINVITVAPIGTQLTDQNGTVFPVASIATGYNASFWATAINQPYLWGNRNSDTDITGVLGSAWQIFYPFQKIVLQQLSNSFNAIVDSNFVNYPEYPHTSMFYYRTETAFSNDTHLKWGTESAANFTTGDPNLSGFYFNSYTYVCPLVVSSNANFQCLAVRGYSPTETSETLIRFVLPNKYDFGYVTSYDLITEISSLKVSSSNFTYNYAYILSNFDTAFQQSNSFFGQELVPNFEGSNINSSNFAEFAYQFSSIYGNYQSNQNLLDKINNFVQSNIVYFISTQMPYIIPPQAITRQNYTGPIPFSILWKTGLADQYKNLTEFWGLGYNLGYSKIDTPYSTYSRATSFYKILDDYIYLRLNPEYNMNVLGSTSNEDFTITRDSTGQINNYYGKLLLANFGQYSQTMMQNQAAFNPPISRIDQFLFQWVNEVGEVIDNTDCDWTATLTITENVQNQTIRLPPLPPINGGRSIQ